MVVTFGESLHVLQCKYWTLRRLDYPFNTCVLVICSHVGMYGYKTEFYLEIPLSLTMYP